MTLATKRALRFKFLRALYEKTEGRTSSQLQMWHLGESLGIDRVQTSDLVEYLANQALLERRAMGGTIGISHAGVMEIEQALSEPERPTEHFPASINITNVGTMIGSQIQQGSHGSQQRQSEVVVDLGHLQSFTRLARQHLPSLDIAAPEKAEAEADLATLEAQAASGRPKVSIIRESLQSLRNILEGASGSVVASELVPKLMTVLASLGGTDGSTSLCCPPESVLSSIVLELQREALDPVVRTSDLLRKALVVAKKLRIDELDKWVSAELGGYEKTADVPPYRVITGLGTGCQ